MEFQFVKIVVFTPVGSAEKIRNCLAESGCGKIGNYDSCSFSTPGKGRFRPLAGSKPTIGKRGNVEVVDEEKIEVVCAFEKYKKVVEKVRKAHPYEEPAIEVYPMLHPGETSRQPYF